MTTHSPVLIAAAGALLITGCLAWILKAIVAIGRATRIGEPNARH